MATLKPFISNHIQHMITVTPSNKPLYQDEAARSAYLDSIGLTLPKSKTEEGLQLRFLCPVWWKRSLDRLTNRNIEHKEIKAGRVAKNRQKYASNTALHIVGKQTTKTLDFMKTQSMVSDSDDVIEMLDIIKGGLANPQNRRAELMVRMAGCEIFAATHGMVGEFYTLTCPSKFHKYSGNEQNPNYAEYSPKFAQEYLNDVWASIRKKMQREGLSPFGFRVAEPHHDGCPHWHMLLFIQPSRREELRAIFAQFALAMDGDEAGAEKHRFTFVQINPEVGTATGYIAKYISKNLGFAVDDMENDKNAMSVEYGQRVKAWASIWGIRQFQQIGASPVGVWRQLRKLKDVLEDDQLEAARVAADTSQWATFMEIMGGIDIKRADRPIQLLKKNMIDLTTGELLTNRYTELTLVVLGVVCGASHALTRLKSWLMVNSDLVSKGEDNKGHAVGGAFVFPPWSSVNNCPQGSL